MTGVQTCALPISEINKRINECIRNDNKVKRINVIIQHIEKTGGIKKALKELACKKEWMPNLQSKQGLRTTKRKQILNIATEFYKNVYNSNKSITINEDVDTLDSDSDETIPAILVSETEKAIKRSLL